MKRYSRVVLHSGYCVGRDGFEPPMLESASFTAKCIASLPPALMLHEDNPEGRTARRRFTPSCCGSGGIRTRNPLLAKQSFYRWNYAPKETLPHLYFPVKSAVLDSNQRYTWVATTALRPLGATTPVCITWLDLDSNQRPRVFQAHALPSELSNLESGGEIPRLRPPVSDTGTLPLSYHQAKLRPRAAPVSVNSQMASEVVRKS